MKLYRVNGKYFYGYFCGDGYFDSDMICYIMNDYGDLVEVE